MKKLYKKFITWLARHVINDAVARQKHEDQMHRAELTRRHKEELLKVEEQIGEIIGKLMDLKIEYRLKPTPRVVVGATFPVSEMGWMGGRFGMDEVEKEYIAKHIGRMVEREVYHMKPIPVDR